MSRPMPREPPVTSAVFPRSSDCIVRLVESFARQLVHLNTREQRWRASGLAKRRPRKTRQRLRRYYRPFRNRAFETQRAVAIYRAAWPNGPIPPRPRAPPRRSCVPRARARTLLLLACPSSLTHSNYVMTRENADHECARQYWTQSDGAERQWSPCKSRPSHLQLLPRSGVQRADLQDTRNRYEVYADRHHSTIAPRRQRASGSNPLSTSTGG